jgi:Ciliary BBSome complex subunit 2, N-terminal
VTALAAGRLAADSQADTLLVCTETNLLAYDVERNADLYFKEVPDGANAVAIGTVSITACNICMSARVHMSCCSTHTMQALYR